MEKKYFSLETRDDNKFTRIIRIIFGFICCAIAIFWLIFRYISVQADSTQWITIAFLVLFGAFQVFAGFGLADKFIEIYDDKIKLKQNSVLPAVDFSAGQLTRIELFPLKLLLFTGGERKVLLRFGISEPNKIELIKDEIKRFAERNGVKLEIKSE